MDRRDKRFKGAAIAAAIALIIVLLGAGWYFAGRDDSAMRAGVTTPATSSQPAAGSGTAQVPPTASDDAPGQAPDSAAAGTPRTTVPGPSEPPSPSSPQDQAPSRTASQPPPDAAGQPSAPAAAGAAVGAPSAGAAGTSILTDDQVAALPRIRAPSFDVVRVNELGDAVIAGRAEPRSVVIIYDGDREIGRVAADSRGEWVFVSDRPLTPGQHEIGLLSQSGPQSRLSEQIVVLIAPEPRQDIAGRPSDGDAEREKPLALLVPRAEIGATTVLQSPPAAESGGPAEGAPSSPAGSDGGAPVSIDVVDYDDEGQLIVSGRSAPQSDVRLYLDNEYVGTARTGADGSFQVQPADPVAPGVYALRVDEVGPAGSVLARAETPFQRADAVETLPGFSRVVVQPGNSLWRIARQVYGEGIQYTVIYQANTGQIRDPDLIYPGQIFNVPEMPGEVPGGDPS